MPSDNSQTRRQRLEEREETILAAAHAEFVENGFEGARIAAIARRAGVAEGTLYLYFRNKDALLAAVVGAFYQRLTAGAMAGVAARDATDERLAFLARHHLDSCLAEWSILVLALPALYQAGNYRSSGYFQFNRSYVAVFDGVVREGITRGDVRSDLPLHLLRDLFYGTLEHAVRTAMIREQAPPAEAEVGSLAAQVMALIRPAFGLTAGPAKPPGGEIGSVTRRLEAVVERLERCATGSSRATPD